MPEPSVSGGCLCGGVRFELSEPATDAGYCHCTRCQRRTGGASSAQARIDARHAWMAAALDSAPHLRLPRRPAAEQFVASSIQFSLVGLGRARIAAVIAACTERGVHIKWFGAAEPVGFTSVWSHWRYFDEPQSLPNAERVLGGLCDMRLPLTLTQADCAAIGSVVHECLSVKEC